MGKLEETKHREVIEGHGELLKQLQESLNVEKTERCAAVESSKLLMQEYHTKHETQMQDITRLMLQERSKDFSETLANELSTRLMVVETNMKAHTAAVVKELMGGELSGEVKTLSENLNNNLFSLREDLDREVHLRENSLQNLRDEVQVNNKKYLDALDQQIACRKADKYNHELGMKELHEKADTFQTQASHLWNAIEMVGAANSSDTHTEPDGFQPSMSHKKPSVVVNRSSQVPQQEVVVVNSSRSTQFDLEPPAMARLVSPIVKPVEQQCRLAGRRVTCEDSWAIATNSSVAVRSLSCVPAFAKQPTIEATIASGPFATAVSYLNA